MHLQLLLPSQDGCFDISTCALVKLVNLCTCELVHLWNTAGHLSLMGRGVKTRGARKINKIVTSFCPAARFIACVRQTENKQISFSHVLKTHILSSEWRDDVETKNCCTFFGSLCVAGLTRMLRLFEGWTFRRADNRKSSIIQTPPPDIWFGARVHTLAIIFPSNFPFL